MVMHAESTSLRSLLEGTVPGRGQSVGLMQVVPLIARRPDNRYVSPVLGRAEIATTAYGTILFINNEPRPMIVPAHAAWVVNQAAQDHAMAHAGLVPAGGVRAFDTALCVQSGQRGMIRRGRYEMSVLPLSLRPPALAMRRFADHSRLWPELGEFTRRHGLPRRADLRCFLRRYRRQLELFVAEFEPVPGQVGAVILIDGRVAGIERAPGEAYWRSIWPALIRVCYGSAALERARRAGGPPAPPATRVPLPDSVRSLDDLAAALSRVEAEEARRTRRVLDESLALDLRAELDDEQDDLALETLWHDRLAGQAVRHRHDDRIVYASLTRTGLDPQS